MISAARTTIDRSRGFTLIEVVIVLAVAAVFTAGAVGMLVYSSDDRALRNASGKIELMAKQAHTIAILQQTPYALEFREGVVRMMPLAQAGVMEKKGRGSQVAEADSSRVFNLDEGMAIFIQRWNSPEWHSTLKDTVHVWRFDPDGLCEPISVRVTKGKSYNMDSFHPLTATVSYSESETRK